MVYVLVLHCDLPPAYRNICPVAFVVPFKQCYVCHVLLVTAAKVRRLYDIANVLTTLQLIRKKTFLAPNHRKMPGYSWAGPSMDQIRAIRKYEISLML